MTRPQIKIEVQRPILLSVTLVGCALALLRSGYYRRSCTPLSDRDLDMIKSYVLSRYSIDDPAVKVTEEGVLPESCVHRVKVAGVSAVPPLWYVSNDRKYIFQLAGIISEPQPRSQSLTAAARSGLESGSAPVLGAKTSANTVVVFSDFQCPYCAVFARTMREMNIPGGKAGMRLLFRHYPLPFHEHARPAAEVAACLAAQDSTSFWVYHDYLFENQSRLGEGSFLESASLRAASKGKSVDLPRLKACTSRHESAAAVDTDMRLAEKLGVEGTPTVFVNGVRLSGAPNQAAVVAALSVGPQLAAR